MVEPVIDLVRVHVHAPVIVEDPVIAQPCARAADNVGMLDFQKLDVYKRSIEFLRVSLEVIRELPRGHTEHRRGIGSVHAS